MKNTRVRRPAVLVPLLCSAWLSGCVSTVGGSAVPGSEPKPAPTESAAEPVRSADLPALLLSAAEISKLNYTTGMTVETDFAAPTVDKEPPSNPDCAGAVIPNLAMAYRGSGYLKTVGQALSDPPGGGGRFSHFTIQAVAVYPSQDAARAFAESSRRQWSVCAEQHLTYTYDNGTVENWTIGFPTGSDDVVSMINSLDGGGWFCARSMTSRSNVVVDVAACGNGTSVHRSAELATRIRNKIPA